MGLIVPPANIHDGTVELDDELHRRNAIRSRLRSQEFAFWEFRQARSRDVSICAETRRDIGFERTVEKFEIIREKSFDKFSRTVTML